MAECLIILTSNTSVSGKKRKEERSTNEHLQQILDMIKGISNIKIIVKISFL